MWPRVPAQRRCKGHRAGRLKSIPGHITSLTYNARGQVTVAAYANGVTTNNLYNDQRGWLNRVVTQRGVTTLQDITYARAATGRISSVSAVRAEDNWTYTYDHLDRLLSATNSGNGSLSQTFTYDAAHNMLTNSKVGAYAYPVQGAGTVRPHAATQAGSYALTYDAAGNLKSKIGGTVTHGLTWDAENKLSRVLVGAARSVSHRRRRSHRHRSRVGNRGQREDLAVTFEAACEGRAFIHHLVHVAALDQCERTGSECRADVVLAGRHHRDRDAFVAAEKPAPARVDRDRTAGQSRDGAHPTRQIADRLARRSRTKRAGELAPCGFPTGDLAGLIAEHPVSKTEPDQSVGARVRERRRATGCTAVICGRARGVVCWAFAQHDRTPNLPIGGFAGRSVASDRHASQRKSGARTGVEADLVHDVGGLLA